MKDEGFGSLLGCEAGIFNVYKAVKCSLWLVDFFLCCSQV